MQTEEARRATNIKYYENNRDKFAAKREEYRERNARIVLEIKLDVPCMDCGGVFPPFVMDFDHVRGEKLGDVSTLVRGSSVERLLAEIAKCELVCANCHRVRTFVRTAMPL